MSKAYLTLEALEDRLAMSTASMRVLENTLIINGTEAAESVLVTESDAGMIKVTMIQGGGAIVQTFDPSNFSSIQFIGNGGEDIFYNNTDIDSIFIPGEGLPENSPSTPENPDGGIITNPVILDEVFRNINIVPEDSEPKDCSGGHFHFSDPSKIAIPIKSPFGHPGNNMQPQMVLPYCLALQGLFPSRN